MIVEVVEKRKQKSVCLSFFGCDFKILIVAKFLHGRQPYAHVDVNSKLITCWSQDDAATWQNLSQVEIPCCGVRLKECSWSTAKNDSAMCTFRTNTMKYEQLTSRKYLFSSRDETWKVNSVLRSTDCEEGHVLQG